VSAFTFELSKVQTIAIRTRMLGHLRLIEPELHDRVATAMGMQGMADPIRPAVQPRDLVPSPALSILAKAPDTLRGRKLGILVGDGFDGELVSQLVAAATAEHAAVDLVAPRIGGARTAGGELVPAQHAIAGGPSVLFDAVAVVAGGASVAELLAEPAAISWVGDAFLHCKVIGVVAAGRPLLDAARVRPDAGVIDLTGDSIETFIAAAKQGRLWAREAAPRRLDPPLPGEPTRSAGSGRAAARGAKQ
jgi:catalase